MIDLAQMYDCMNTSFPIPKKLNIEFHTQIHLIFSENSPSMVNILFLKKKDLTINEIESRMKDYICCREKGVHLKIKILALFKQR